MARGTLIILTIGQYQSNSHVWFCFILPEIRAAYDYLGWHAILNDVTKDSSIEQIPADIFQVMAKLCCLGMGIDLFILFSLKKEVWFSCVLG